MERMSQHPAQEALTSCKLAVFVLGLRTHVSIHSRMCMLDWAGGGLGTLGCIKRRCFQSDRASSVFTQRLFRKLTFLFNVSLLSAPRMPRIELTSSRPLTQPFTVRLRMRPGFQGAAGLRRTCGCSCPDVKHGEDLKHISCCSRVMLCGDKGHRSTRMTWLSLPLR